MPRNELRTKISPLARVSEQATIGEGCQIGDFTIIHDNVKLGEGSIVESHSIIGHPTPLADGKSLFIGPGAHIRSHSVFYEGSTIGPRLVTGHRVVVREYTQAGAALQIGTGSDLQGHLQIGNHVRTHSNVFLAQHGTIGDYAWLFPHVVTTDDPHPPSDVRRGVVIEEFAAVGAHSTILPGINLGVGSLVAAHSLVNRDLPAGMVVGGVPARVICEASKIKHQEDGLPAYPWTRHFKRGYPADVVERWLHSAADEGKE